MPLVTVSTARGPASLRVQVWRKLRSLGALHLQQSVCLLRERERRAREVRRLLAQVRESGGTGRALTIAMPEARERVALVAELNAARYAEYTEVRDRLPGYARNWHANGREGPPPLSPHRVCNPC